MRTLKEILTPLSRQVFSDKLFINIVYISIIGFGNELVLHEVIHLPVCLPSCIRGTLWWIVNFPYLVNTCIVESVQRSLSVFHFFMIGVSNIRHNKISTTLKSLSSIQITVANLYSPSLPPSTHTNSFLSFLGL